MIASHNSYTYLDANNSIINTFTNYWRCQNESITEQYKKGVRYFDVRVFREVNSKGKNTWRCAHGEAELSKVFTTLKSICTYFTSSLKGCKIRIVLEKGDSEDVEAFKKEVMPLTTTYECLDWVVIKKPWTTLYQDSQFTKVYDLAYEQWGVWDIVKNVFNKPIMEHAKTVNPELTQEILDDEHTVYYLDYATYKFE